VKREQHTFGFDHPGLDLCARFVSTPTTEDEQTYMSAQENGKTIFDQKSRTLTPSLGVELMQHQCRTNAASMQHW